MKIDSGLIKQSLKPLSGSRTNELRFNGNRLEVTDGGVFVSTSLDTNDHLECVVGYSDFSKVVGTLSGVIDIDLDGSNMVIKHGKRGRVVLPHYEKGLEWLDDTKPVSRLSGLCDALLDVSFAASTDDLRPVMCGVNLCDGDMVSTDAHILSLRKYDAGGLSVNIPSSVVRVLSSLDGDCDVRMSDRKVVFDFGSVIVGGVLLEGRYPNYQAVIPRMNDQSIRLERKPFLESLKRAHSCVSSRVVEFRADGFELVITCNDIDFGKSYEDVVVVECIGSALPKFDLSKLISVVSSLRGDVIEMSYKDTTRAALFIEDGRQVLLMPMI